MILSRGQRVYLIRDQIIGSALFNFGLNAGLGWLFFRAQPQVPMWGNPSIAADFTGMLFFLPLLTGLCVVPIINFLVKMGKLEPLLAGIECHPLVKRLPHAFWLRSLVIALASVAVFAPIALALLRASGVASMPLMSFVVLKGVVSALEAAIVSPLLAIAALAHARPRT